VPDSFKLYQKRREHLQGPLSDKDLSIWWTNDVVTGAYGQFPGSVVALGRAGSGKPYRGGTDSPRVLRSRETGADPETGHETNVTAVQRVTKTMAVRGL